MPIARWIPIRFYFEYCLLSRSNAQCSSRQIRNGLFAINLIAWVFIILAIRRFAG